MLARRGRVVRARVSVLAACLAALLVSLAPHARAEPATPEIAKECRAAVGGLSAPGGVPGPCDQAEGLASLACPIPPPVLGRSLCERVDDIFAATIAAGRENANDTFDRYLKILPSRLPEPEPGPAPYVIEQLLDYVDAEFNGDDIEAVVILVIGEGTVQNQTERSVLVITNLTFAFAEILVETAGLGGPTNGAICTGYGLWTNEAHDRLREEWDRTGGLPPFPEQLFPAICHAGGVDISLSWLSLDPQGAES